MGRHSPAFHREMYSTCILRHELCLYFVQSECACLYDTCRYRYNILPVDRVVGVKCTLVQFVLVSPVTLSSKITAWQLLFGGSYCSVPADY